MTNSNPNLRIFNYVIGKCDLTRDENIFIYKNFIDYTYGKSSFTFATEKDYLQMLDLLNLISIQHTTNVSSTTYTLPPTFDDTGTSTYEVVSYEVQITR